MVAIFTYGFPEAEENFEKAKCKLFTLSNYYALLEQAVESSFIKESDLPYLTQWREAPDKWGK